MGNRKLTTMYNHKKTVELFEAYTPTPTPIVIAVTITEENYKSIADLIDAKVDAKGIYMIPGIVDRANFGEVLVYNQRESFEVYSQTMFHEKFIPAKDADLL